LHQHYSNFNSEPREKEIFATAYSEELKINDVNEQIYHNLNYNNIHNQLSSKEVNKDQNKFEADDRPYFRSLN
jgi:hypothetical protein